MYKKRTRIWSMLLVAALLLSLLPVTALANSYENCTDGDSCTQHEAAIGSTHYDTIGEAIDAANKTSGSDTITITLLKDATLTGGEQSGYYKIKRILKNITLDLGTHKLTYNENGGFAVDPNCHFTIQNGTYINASTDAYAQAIEGTKRAYEGPGCTITIAKDAVIQAAYGICADGHTTINVYGKIISTVDGIFGAGPKNNVMLDGATIEAGVYGVYQQSKDGGSTYTIKNSTITTPSEGATCAVFISNNKASAEDTEKQGMQTLVIENSVISGQDGIEVMYTDVTISGENTEVTAAADGHALGVTYYKDEGEAAVGTLSISGGTFKGGIGFMEGEANTATLTISGGTFTDDVSEYIQSGMTQDENGEIVETVATFNGNTYGTLTAAINAANSAEGGTVTLLKDATLSTPLDEDVTLSVSSAVLTVEATGLGNLTKGTLEIKQGGGLKLGTDELVGTDGTINLTRGSVTMNGGTVTLTSGSEAEIPNGETFYLMLGNGGPALNAVIEQGATLTVANGGTLKAVSGSGESGSQVTVKGTLDVKGTLTIALQADVTVENGGTLNLPAMTKATMGSATPGEGMKGDIVVKAGGKLNYSTANVLGGSNPLMTLTEGSATLNLGNANATEPSVSLTLNGKASVDGSTKALLLAADNDGTIIPIAISVAGTSEATVSKNGVLNLVNGSSLTVEDTAKFEVAGILEVHSAAKFDDKATVSGKVYVFEANGGANPISGANITLTKTGAVYAEKTELTGSTITPAHMADSSEKYTSTSSNVGEKSFAQQWTFSYKITLDANGGTLADGISELWTNTEGKLTAMPGDPTRSGYTFNGWYDAATGGNEVDANTVFTGDTTIYAQWTYNGSSSGGSSTTYYSSTVEKTENGTVTVSPKNASRNTTVTITVTPDEGYELDTLTVTDKDGKAVELTKVSDTKYTFKMPASRVTITAAFADEEIVSSLSFTDVSVDDWFYEAVQHAYENGMMNGVGNNLFAPSSNLTRGMIAQVLYNLEGTPAAGSGVFTDVAADQWYADAVNWAAANDIVGGYGNGKFGPEDDITREQMAAILYRYGEYKGYDVTNKANLSKFEDNSEISAWAQTALSWASADGLIEGDGDKLMPKENAQRCQVAAILMRFCQNVVE